MSDSRLKKVKFSILDLVPIVEGGTASEAFKNSLQLAQQAEAWGYHRYWLAEHHNMPGIASSATAVAIGYIAAGTKTIRVGAGGIMLPNHPPLVIAEQFGTLESLYPGRIDLGLGRAPGTDQLTARALRRQRQNELEFPQLVQELFSYLEPAAEDGRPQVKAYPGVGLYLPIWLLGSSTFSARLAAQLGLPFAFASHFAPDYLHEALDLYRAHFQPSQSLSRPYVMIGINIFAADSEQEAQRIATSQEQQFLNLIRGKVGRLPPPVGDMEQIWTEEEKAIVRSQLRYTIAGTLESIEQRLLDILRSTQADEIIISAPIYEHQARLRSYQLISQLLDQGESE